MAINLNQIDSNQLGNVLAKIPFFDIKEDCGTATIYYTVDIKDHIGEVIVNMRRKGDALAVRICTRFTDDTLFVSINTSRKMASSDRDNTYRIIETHVRSSIANFATQGGLDD